jgi:hypothetical protein
MAVYKSPSILLLATVLISHILIATSLLTSVKHVPTKISITRSHRTFGSQPLFSTLKDASVPETKEPSIWENLATIFHPNDDKRRNDIQTMKDYSQSVTLLRVGLPSLFLAASAKIAYPTVAIMLANSINDSGVFAVVAQDASQYIQNICTTSGLMFSILAGQTYYFMYQQQEAIYLALFEEVTTAKSLLEQVSLVARGRELLYSKLLTCIQEYVQEDLTKFNDIEPAYLIASRPCDDPLEGILYLTSVGEPSVIYQTVRSLRQARAARLGALQRKLPQIHMILLWTLAGIVLFTFPLLGAGVQTIGGMGILIIQSWYLSFIVFGICAVLGVVNELRQTGETGVYNARNVLNVMVAGLEEELELRLSGTIQGPPANMEPSVDNVANVISESILVSHSRSDATAFIVPVEADKESKRGVGLRQRLFGRK